jgi:hypothetical protein
MQPKLKPVKKQTSTSGSSRELVSVCGTWQRVFGDDFLPVAPTPGTRAFEYLNGKRNPDGLLSDPELLAVFDDKHPQGGLLYLFRDRSSVAYKPRNVA